MGRFEIDRNNEVKNIIKLYGMDKELRDFIDNLYFENYVEYKGKLRLAIRRNLDKINEFILQKDGDK